ADEPGLDPKRVALDPPAGDPPGDDGEEEDDRQRHQPDDGSSDSPPEIAGAERVKGHEKERYEHAAGPDQGRQRVQPMPGSGLERGDRGRRLLGAQSPAAFASPRAESWSRKRSASACSNPGIRASLAAAAVCILTVARPKERAIGPATTSTNCILP